MTNWQIGESAISVSLREDGRGELAFTVTNTGPAQDRAVLTITALDGAAEAWFTVDEPQRLVGAGMSVVYRVAVAAPPGTAAGTYAVTGIVYSADSDPSESSATSKRIELVVTTARPAPRAPRWPYLVAVLAVVLVAAVVGAIVLTRDDAEAEPPEPPETALPDLWVVTTPECDFYPAFAGGFLFEVDAGVRADGPLGSATSVPVLLRAEATGAESTSYVAIGDAAPNTILAVDVGIAFERADRYTLVVDPYNEIAEADESNNEVIVLVEFLDAGTVPCYVA